MISHHNNISVEAKAQDSVIYINTPGPNSKVIIDGGGTVDVVAEGKLTLQSKTKVEINSPTVEINGQDLVDINGGTVTVDGGPNVRLNDSAGGASITY